MPTDIVMSLASALSKAVCGCVTEACNLHLNDPALCRTLIHLLAEGQAVPVATLAQIIDRPVTDVATVIESSTNVELDEAGNIIGTGLTLRPTPHHMRFENRTLYTWCALDTLMYLPLLGKQAEVESPCAATGVPIRLLITPSGVSSVIPESTVVSVVVPNGRRNVRQNFCNYVHFFSSASAARSWLAQHPGAVVLSVAEAYELGQLLTANNRLDPTIEGWNTKIN
jgi:alkylmercury lyase